MILSERIKEVVKYSGLSIPKFSKAVGFTTPQTVRELISGRTKTLSYAASSKILFAYPEISKQWLETGKGNMIVKPNIPATSESQSNQGIKNDIHGNGSIDVINIGKGASVDSPKNILPDPDNFEARGFEDMAEHFCRRTSELQEELKQKDSEIREFKARLEERDKTIELLRSLLAGRNEIQQNQTK